MERIKKIHLRKSQGFKIIVFCIILLAGLQIWFLYSNYKEIVTKLPADIFNSPRSFPVSELIVNSPYEPSDEAESVSETEVADSENGGKISLEESVETIEAVSDETGEDTRNGTETSEESTTAANTTSGNSDEFELNEIQKAIVLRLMELLEENVEYGYQIYPDSGYPTENIWISTDVISIVLRDVGFDLMELINEDMIDHKEDYPLEEIKERKDPIKYIDFRDVFFQEKFFKRNALELNNEYIIGDKDNNIQWQPGDIVYFQFDPDNPYQDLGGFVSSRKNDDGVPLVIMISKEFGEISEVDKLQEYTIVGHYRYPNPYEDAEETGQTEKEETEKEE